MNPYSPMDSTSGVQSARCAQGEPSQRWNGVLGVMEDIETSVHSVSAELERLSETLDVLGKMALDLEGRIVGTQPKAEGPGNAAIPPPAIPGILGSATACADRAQRLRALLSRLMEHV